MVAIYNNEVVSITGILPLNKSEYDGYEITWTCTKLEHRHKGLIINIAPIDIHAIINGVMLGVTN